MTFILIFPNQFQKKIFCNHYNYDFPDLEESLIDIPIDIPIPCQPIVEEKFASPSVSDDEDFLWIFKPIAPALSPLPPSPAPVSCLSCYIRIARMLDLWNHLGELIIYLFNI